ncbi:MAG: DNA polymerase III subunit gamma/tau [Clostridia bacterium]|nr:DNA polymerase III subunit gamma/tau [Clostridia bacterium]
MSYTALYRKYRPARFDDVIGQDHITETLRNQLKSGRVGHAYLFTGSRGTGKTTCAKIFARAVNCLSPQDGSPCGKCAVCKALADPSNIDILEIDAASNNRVDEVREIRERVKYPPVNGKYKVYIIDEVHMLTDSAFNALLKTLEEPPEFVIFILATTEVHKLPATILSRCMRFDFRLVSVDLLAQNIRRIFDAESKKYEESAVRYIAGAGEGSVRDSLSIADMCLSRAEGTLTLADALDVLGAADRGKIRALTDSILCGNAKQILLSIDELTNLGKSVSRIAKDVLGCARDLLAIKTGATSLVIDTPENMEKLNELAASAEPDALTAVIRTLSAVDAELRYSVSPKIVLETACLRAGKLADSDPDALRARIARLEKRIDELSASGVSAPQSAPTPVRQNAPVEQAPADTDGVWGKLITYFRKNGPMSIYSLLCNTHEVTVKDGVLTVYPQTDAEFLQFSDPETETQIMRAFGANNIALSFKAEKRDAGPDMDSEIDRIKKMLAGGKAKLNITR